MGSGVRSGAGSSVGRGVCSGVRSGTATEAPAPRGVVHGRGEVAGVTTRGAPLVAVRSPGAGGTGPAAMRGVRSYSRGGGADGGAQAILHRTVRNGVGSSVGRGVGSGVGSGVGGDVGSEVDSGVGSDVGSGVGSSAGSAGSDVGSQHPHRVSSCQFVSRCRGPGAGRLVPALAYKTPTMVRQPNVQQFSSPAAPARVVARFSYRVRVISGFPI